jgi:membrane protein YdbS with pleckstrin-like domain
LSEDALVVFLVWFATKHPYVAAGIVAVALCVIALLIHYVVRALRSLFSNAEHALAHESPVP